MSRRLIAILALLVLVAARVGDIHAHACFDGQEAPLSVHLDSLGAHPQHDHPQHGSADRPVTDQHSADQHVTDEQPHSDADLELPSQPLPVSKDLNPALLSALLVLFAAAPQRQRPPSHRSLPAPRRRRSQLRPPLRAPPAPL